MQLYISGPMTGYENNNAAAFLAAADKLKNINIDYVNPVELDISDCKGYEDFLKRDIIYLLDCDGILLLPEWELSYGSRLELAIALKLQFPIFYFDRDELKSLAVICDINFDSVVPSSFWK